MTRIALFTLAAALHLGAQPAPATGRMEANKDLARRFYQEVWFARNVDFATHFFAPEYVLHDPRARDGIREKAEAQKAIAQYWHEQGPLSGRIDFQIADGDKVATRWILRMQLTGWFQRLVAAKEYVEIPIVNVFRFENGKVVEVWNHRDDLGMQEQMRAQGLAYFEGFAFGVVLTLLSSHLLRRRS